MNFNTLEYNEYPCYGVLTLNQPESLNAISPSMIDEIHSFFSLLPRDNIRFVIINGNGKCFSAGGNLSAMNIMQNDEAAIISHKSHETFRLFRLYPVPVVAVVHGFAVGGGFEMAMACDMIFATSEVYFSLPELNFDMIPGGGGGIRLAQKTSFQQSFFHILSRQNIYAQKACDMGIVQKILEYPDYIRETVDLLTKFTNSTEKEAISRLKNTIDMAEEYNVSAFKNESKNFAYLLTNYAKQKINKFFNK